MGKSLASLLVAPAILCGCASTPYGWDLRDEGCFGRTLHEALFVPQAAELEATEIRVGRWVSESDIRVIQFFGRKRNSRDLLVGIGNDKMTCLRKVSSASCPGAEHAYGSLSRIALPVGYGFEKQSPTEFADGTMYFLYLRDGDRNELSWSGSGSEHPVAKEIEGVFVELESCFRDTKAGLQR